MRTVPVRVQPVTGPGNGLSAGTPAAPPAALPDLPDLPELASLAALRAWHEGLTARAAVTRYLDDPRADRQSSRGVITRIRRQLAACAHARQRDDLIPLFTLPAGRRGRHAAAVAHAIDILRRTAVPQPRLTDGVGAWLPPRIAQVLCTVRMRTLAELTLRVPRRRLWWRSIPGLGRTGAHQVEALFAAHPALTGQAWALVERLQPSREDGIAPWEHLQPAPDLDGSHGRFRAPRRACLLNARNDYEGVQAWLALHEAPHTARAYRREAERLMLWAIVERQQPLSSLSTEDAVAYRAFLRHPAPRTRWTGPPRPRDSVEWRPFARSLSPRSAGYALAVLNALFRWLVEQRYVLGNPFAGLTVRGGQRTAPFDTARALTRSEWRAVRNLANRLEGSHGWRAPAAQRLRFLLDFLYATGLRAHELVGATLGDVHIDARGKWWLRVTGKGARAGTVALPPLAREALERYLRQRGLPVTRRRWEPSAPVVASLGLTVHGRDAITSVRLRQLLDVFFGLAAGVFLDKNPEFAARLQQASPHWLRHTHASHALAGGVPLVAVRDNLRHASVSTTSTYLHVDDARRAQQVGAVFGRTGARS
ncbi:tyrosine-type recombinase/integrase [Paraburkholderia sp. CNPSo 3076]|uniref:phage integrase family protein n=1 Tax=Paraburkholderia sp. CNPSo 3076 TaxID=2940936 RepID=UPI00224FEB1E|nr:phage integrase family protein [Paraburkholderia sp. CNPSo 3076]MCX5538078.1 tyrosine-type recombinase/integrase [Paraburkholderia sp. CNPSo 3076]